jgi:hypothetical protein
MLKEEVNKECASTRTARCDVYMKDRAEECLKKWTSINIPNRRNGNHNKFDLAASTPGTSTFNNWFSPEKN